MKTNKSFDDIIDIFERNHVDELNINEEMLNDLVKKEEKRKKSSKYIIILRFLALVGFSFFFILIAKNTLEAILIVSVLLVVALISAMEIRFQEKLKKQDIGNTLDDYLNQRRLMLKEWIRQLRISRYLFYPILLGIVINNIVFMLNEEHLGFRVAGIIYILVLMVLVTKNIEGSIKDYKRKLKALK
ncbi:hypothetical protein DAY19_14375 [Halobacteriovorax vibrionivorans]|uniref:Uncharacterized protein n=2 Tax=Halobacteriovorax TaxID=1652133 RepID=A0ABY0IDX9_9BACT|nr:hypothetical protein [Halobacteriovorax vibrionivorans]RZF21160.1 hypothetical protein DAY19_14375 [Halobacteriovorax vibrionivorans]TGD46079.1 hypothetical protein EP118_13510 [Halobacteriovorax sp. Y22]